MPLVDRNAKRQQQREAHHKNAIDRNIDGFAGLERSHQPFRQSGRDFTGAKNHAERLLHDQTEPPRGEQSVERAFVEKANQPPFDEESGQP